MTNYSTSELFELQCLSSNNSAEKNVYLLLKWLLAIIYWVLIWCQIPPSFIANMYTSSFLLDIIELAENKANQILSVKDDSTVKHLHRFTVVIL